MVTLTAIGVLLSVTALGLAVLALVRTVPPLTVDRRSNAPFWRIRHNGPSSMVIIVAYILDEDQKRRPLGERLSHREYPERSDAGLLFSTSEHPWCRGRILVPHHDFLVEPVSVSRELVIKYRMIGFLGWLSRARLTLTGGP